MFAYLGLLWLVLQYIKSIIYGTIIVFLHMLYSRCHVFIYFYFLPICVPSVLSHMSHISTALLPVSLHQHLIPLLVSVCIQACVVLSLFAGLSFFRPRLPDLFPMVFWFALSYCIAFVLSFACRLSPGFVACLCIAHPSVF